MAERSSAADLGGMPRPGDIDLDEFRRAGHDLIETIAAYHQRLDSRRVLPQISPAEVAARFADALPDLGEPIDDLLADWRDRVEPLLTAIGSPRHFGFVNGSGAMAGIFAEALAATSNTNAGAWKLGPAAVEIERQVLRWVAQFIGYREDCGGIFVSGGTMANFTALLTALRNSAPYDTTPGGLQDERRSGRFLIYMSDHEGHVSVTRVADMLNLGRTAVRLVPSRGDFTMDVAALDRIIAADRARGDLPFCVVAQLGSVNVGAVDPIDDIADVCARYGVWLHGDGAVGLLAAGVPRTAHLFQGLSRADSLSFDAHKWLGVPHDCGAVLVRDGELLRRAFSITAPYLRASRDEGVVDFLEYGPQMSRAFRALKVWMVMRFFGAEGLRALIAKNTALAVRLHELVRDHPDCEVLHEPVLPIYSFRFVPAGCDDRSVSEIDRLNEEIAEAVQRSGDALVMTTKIRGRIALRFSIASQRTLAEDIDRTFGAIVETGRKLVRTTLLRA